MDSNQASEQVQFGEGIFISKFRDRVNNSRGNREFGMLLKLFVKDLNPQNPEINRSRPIQQDVWHQI
jgi:hypothetical protein